MLIYKYDERRVFAGETREITETCGAPLGWTRASPPPLEEGQYAVFSGAEGWRIIDENPAFPPASVPVSVSALSGLLALENAGLSADYEAWATDTARTFAERAFIDKAITWRRVDPVIATAAEALGLSDDGVDQLFIAADQIAA